MCTSLYLYELLVRHVRRVRQVPALPTGTGAQPGHVRLAPGAGQADRQHLLAAAGPVTVGGGGRGPGHADEQLCQVTILQGTAHP